MGESNTHVLSHNSAAGRPCWSLLTVSQTEIKMPGRLAGLSSQGSEEESPSKLFLVVGSRQFPAVVGMNSWFLPSSQLGAALSSSEATASLPL